MVNDDVAGVLVRLSDLHGRDLAGRWFLESGFGHFSGDERIFDTLDSARRWALERISRHLTSDDDPVQEDLGIRAVRLS
jgi:hypothetical protein